MEILILVAYILVINLIGFLTMWYDKKMAIKENPRVSEKSIFTICLLLGSAGVYIGMYKFRHKTKHVTFTVLVPVIFILNIISVYFILHDVIPYLIKLGIY